MGLHGAAAVTDEARARVARKAQSARDAAGRMSVQAVEERAHLGERERAGLAPFPDPFEDRVQGREARHVRVVSVRDKHGSGALVEVVVARPDASRSGQGRMGSDWSAPLFNPRRRA